MYDWQIPVRSVVQIAAVLIACLVSSACQDGQALPTKNISDEAGEAATAKVTPEQEQPKRFVLWATADAHIDVDEARGRKSLVDAITDSEQGGDEGGSAFDWNIMLHLGDLAGGGGFPEKIDGVKARRQLAASQKHRREDFYFLAGNHDASPDHWWFRTWMDPPGAHTEVSGVDNARRPFPVEGTWERYSVQVGNILFLMMSDRNDGPPPSGRTAPDPTDNNAFRGRPRGGYPAGKVTDATFQWWKEMVERHRDKIIITGHHHMLEHTTVASGLDEGIEGLYHGYNRDGAPRGASFLYFVGDLPHAGKFESYLEKNPGAIDLWLGGHTHSNPDDTYGGKSHIERKWGVTFVNCGALTVYHSIKRISMSRVLTFVDGSNSVKVQCYLHTSDYAPEGWYQKAERQIQLKKPFDHGE